jgi:uncharacterized heparinase superfamily protein
MIQLMPIRFYNTIKHLKIKQFTYRLKYSLVNKIPWKTLIFSRDFASTDNEFINLHQRTAWLEREAINADHICQGTFHFLNRKAFFPNKIQWSTINRCRLWTYNLNYFDYLLAAGGLNPATVEKLIRDWLTCNPACTLDAWGPFPTSLRIVNWLKYASLPHGRLPEAAVASIQHQCNWLERFVEYHLLGNHLFKNGKALLFAGLAFNGRDAVRWIVKGLRIIENQLGEQILSDGGHFERSPMYHSMILEDVLDLLNIIPAEERWAGLQERLSYAAERMSVFLDAMTHPDGRIALFNDAAFNIEASPQTLVDYYMRVTGTEFKPKLSTCHVFKDSGYYVMSPATSDKLIIDCGVVGYAHSVFDPLFSAGGQCAGITDL